MADVRHIGFVLLQFWTFVNAPLLIPANGVMIRSDANEVLRFYDFADLAGKCLLRPF